MKTNLFYKNHGVLTSHERLIRAIYSQEVDRPPVWLMRQAGRYLPEYRALKVGKTTRQMMQTPDVACEITLQPLKVLGVDAAILYSDILMIPDALGLGLEFMTGEGPKFAKAVQTQSDVEALHAKNFMDRLGYVFQTIKLCIKKLKNSHIPLLGFAGAPFTVACYMVSGGASSGFLPVKKIMQENSVVFKSLLQILTDCTILYLQAQAQAGVLAVQLFDSWAGLLLNAKDYAEFSLPYSRQIFSALKKANIPSIHFAKGTQDYLEQIMNAGSDVVSVDWQVSLAAAQDKFGAQVALQGNFNPDNLLTSPELIRLETQQMLRSLPQPKRGYIANLGHGISKDTPVQNVLAFVNAVKEFT